MPLYLIFHKRNKGTQLQITHVRKNIHNHVHTDMLTNHVMKENLAKQALIMEITSMKNIQNISGWIAQIRSIFVDRIQLKQEKSFPQKNWVGQRGSSTP